MKGVFSNVVLILNKIMPGLQVVRSYIELLNKTKLCFPRNFESAKLRLKIEMFVLSKLLRLRCAFPLLSSSCKRPRSVSGLIPAMALSLLKMQIIRLILWKSNVISDATRKFPLNTLLYYPLRFTDGVFLICQDYTGI